MAGNGGPWATHPAVPPSIDPAVPIAQSGRTAAPLASVGNRVTIDWLPCSPPFRRWVETTVGRVGPCFGVIHSGPRWPVPSRGAGPVCQMAQHLDFIEFSRRHRCLGCRRRFNPDLTSLSYQKAPPDFKKNSQVLAGTFRGIRPRASPVQGRPRPHAPSGRAPPWARHRPGRLGGGRGVRDPCRASGPVPSASSAPSCRTRLQLPPTPICGDFSPGKWYNCRPESAPIGRSCKTTSREEIRWACSSR